MTLYISQLGSGRKAVYNRALIEQATVLEQTAAEKIQAFTNQTNPAATAAASNTVVVDLTGIAATTRLRWQNQLTLQGFGIAYLAPNLTISLP